MMTGFTSTAGPARLRAHALFAACCLGAFVMVPSTALGTAERPMSPLDGMVSIEASPCGAQPAGRPPCTNTARPAAFIKLAVSSAGEPANVVSVTTDQSGEFHLALPPGRYRIGLHRDMRDLLMTELDLELVQGGGRRVELKVRALSP